MHCLRTALLEVARVGGGGGAQLLCASRPRDGVQMVRLFGESVDVLVRGPRRTCSKHHAGAQGQGEIWSLSPSTGARAEAWCLLIHVKAPLSGACLLIYAEASLPFGRLQRNSTNEAWQTCRRIFGA
jgi:hypothetical protein